MHTILPLGHLSFSSVWWCYLTSSFTMTDLRQQIAQEPKTPANLLMTSSTKSTNELAQVETPQNTLRIAHLQYTSNHQTHVQICSVCIRKLRVNIVWYLFTNIKQTIIKPVAVCLYSAVHIRYKISPYNEYCSIYYVVLFHFDIA